MAGVATALRTQLEGISALPGTIGLALGGYTPSPVEAADGPTTNGGRFVGVCAWRWPRNEERFVMPGAAKALCRNRDAGDFPAGAQSVGNDTTQERWWLVVQFAGFCAGSGAIRSSEATICHLPLRRIQVSVQTKRARSGVPVRRTQDSFPCATAVSPKK